MSKFLLSVTLLAGASFFGSPASASPQAQALYEALNVQPVQRSLGTIEQNPFLNPGTTLTEKTVSGLTCLHMVDIMIAQETYECSIAPNQFGSSGMTVR